MSISHAQAWMKERAGVWYDSKFLSEFIEMQRSNNREEDNMEYCVGLELLRNGDILAEDLVLHNGNTMLTAGQEVNPAMIEKLRVYEQTYNTKITLFIC